MLAHRATRFTGSIALVAAHCKSPCDGGIMLSLESLATDRPSAGAGQCECLDTEGRQRVERPIAAHAPAIVTRHQRLLLGRKAARKCPAYLPGMEQR